MRTHGLVVAKGGHRFRTFLESLGPGYDIGSLLVAALLDQHPIAMFNRHRESLFPQYLPGFLQGQLDLAIQVSRREFLEETF